jgi:hypothetical protein
MTSIDAVTAPPQNITVHRHGTSRRYGCRTYKFFDEAVPFLERQGWKLVRRSTSRNAPRNTSYAHMAPPAEIADVPKEVPIRAEIPDLGELERFADAVHADAQPARGSIGPWTWEYRPARQSVRPNPRVAEAALEAPFRESAIFLIGIPGVWDWFKRWGAYIPAVEPRVFERDGVAYANTRDLAAHFGQDHRKIVQSIKQAIETDRELFEFEMYEDEVIEVAYRDSSGQMAVSYDLTFGGYICFSLMMRGRRRSSAHILDTYDHTFIDKEKEIEKRKASAEQADTLAEQVSVLKKRNAYLAQDNIRLTQQNADLSYWVRQMEIALREELEDAVSPSLFRN